MIKSPPIIFSLSKNLIDLNVDLVDDIHLVQARELVERLKSNDVNCVLFEWQMLLDVLKIKAFLHKNKVFGTRFICVSSEMHPEDRLKLINNNIEFLSIENFAAINPYYFKLNANNQKYRILLIEDDPEQIMVTEEILKSANLEVKSIQRGENALDQIEDYSPDLILLDYHLKGMTGDKLVRLIRKNPKHSLLPIVILTQDHSEETRIESVKAGADDLITKPINSELLVSALLNRMQRSSESLQLINSKKNRETAVIHSIDEFRVDELGMFMDINRENQNASVIWMKIENCRSLQKELGFIGYQNLCQMALNRISKEQAAFELAVHITDAVLVFASNMLSRKEALLWINSTQKWLKSNYFSYDNMDYYLRTKFLLLTDIPGKPEDINLIAEAEKLILERFLEDEISYVAEGIEEKHFYLIKRQLEHAIQVRNFKWWYQTIISTKDPDQEIYQLFLRVMTDKDNEIASDEYFEVAKKTGLIKLFDRFTLEHSLRIISLESEGNKNRRVLINQNLADFDSKQERRKKIETITKLDVPGHSLIFQFRMDDVLKHSHILQIVAEELKDAKICICMSHFDCSEQAWKIAQIFEPHWLRFLPLSNRSEWLEANHPDHISHSIDKAHKLNYKVMVSEVDSAEFAANTWNLHFDYMQGFFIQTPILEEFLSIKTL